MPLEKEVIIDAFKKEGLDEKLADGLNFEDEATMNGWIGTAKNFNTITPESLDKFTPEQLLEYANSRKSRSLQSLLDSIKTSERKKVEDELKKKATPPEEKKGNKEEKEMSPELKAKFDLLDELVKEREEAKKAKKEKEKADEWDKTFLGLAKGIDKEDLEYIKATLKVGSSEQEIKDAIAKYSSLMSKRGFKNFGVETSSKKAGEENVDKDLEASVKRIADKKNKK